MKIVSSLSHVKRFAEHYFRSMAGIIYSFRHWHSGHPQRWSLPAGQRQTQSSYLSHPNAGIIGTYYHDLLNVLFLDRW
jgi:hypothetical protein